MSAKTDPEHAFSNVLASLCIAAAQDLDDGVTDGQAAVCLEACRAAGIVTMRQVARILGSPSNTFVVVQSIAAATLALDDAGLTPEECPRLAAACAEEWRRAFLCH